MGNNGESSNYWSKMLGIFFLSGLIVVIGAVWQEWFFILGGGAIFTLGASLGCKFLRAPVWAGQLGLTCSLVLFTGAIIMFLVGM